MLNEWDLMFLNVYGKLALIIVKGTWVRRKND
jgi:hypothetical protein